MIDIENFWNSFNSYLPCFFLASAILSLWIKRSPIVWGTLFFFGILLGFVTDRLQWISLISIIALGVLFYITFQVTKYKPWLRITCGLLGCILSVALGFHLIPGFNNFKVITDTILSPGAYPYSLYLNFDKALVGLFILAFGWTYINHASSLKKNIIKTLPIILLTIVILIPLAIALKYVQFDPKFTSIFWIWALVNLLFGCVPEEALFRGVIQNSLTRTFSKYSFAPYLAILITSILFGLAHFFGGPKFMFLSFVAGLFYGWAYYRSKRIEASIATHFILNATHFLGFTYPALKLIN